MMIGGLEAVILLCSLQLAEAADVPQKISLKMVEVGGNITLKCGVSESDGKFFYWYKQPLGHMVQTVAAVGAYREQTLAAQFENQRFQVSEEDAHYLLSITNVSKDDEATYFCHSGTAYSQSFVGGIFLAVTDDNQDKSVVVKQSPVTASVQAGDEMVFKCSLPSTIEDAGVQCPGEDSVFWFRAGSGESHPAVIYTHNKKRVEKGERSCVYSLSTTMDSSDAGTFYCAVVLRGEILFGSGSTLDTRPDLYPALISLSVLLACCVTVIFILVLRLNRTQSAAGEKNVSHDPGQDESTVNEFTEQDDNTEAENYAALNFSTRKARSVKKHRESLQDCVYSAVRADDHTLHHTPP